MKNKDGLKLEISQNHHEAEESAPLNSDTRYENFEKELTNEKIAIEHKDKLLDLQKKIYEEIKNKIKVKECK